MRRPVGSIPFDQSGAGVSSVEPWALGGMSEPNTDDPTLVATGMEPPLKRQ